MATTVPFDSDTEVPEIDGGSREGARISNATGIPPQILGTAPLRIRPTPFHKLVLGLGGVGVFTLVSVLAWGSSMEFPKDVGRDIGLKIDDEARAIRWFCQEVLILLFTFHGVRRLGTNPSQLVTRGFKIGDRAVGR